MQSQDTDQVLERFTELKTRFKNQYGHDAFLALLQAVDAMHDVYEDRFDDHIPLEQVGVVNKMLEKHTEARI